MMKDSFFALALFLLVVCQIFITRAQTNNETLEINLTEAGKLSSKITVEQQKAVKHLTVKGSINVDDTRFIRKLKSLETLNLGEANIVEFKRSETLTYPAGVLEAGTFDGNKTLKQIVLPKTLQEIGGSAFRNSVLESITLPEGLEKIGVYAFAFCEKIKTISIPGSLKVIEPLAFNGCTAAESLTLAEGLKVLGDRMFANCISLKAVLLPKSLERIGEKAFGNCKKITEVTLPPKVSSLGSAVFNGIPALEKLIVEPLEAPTVPLGAFDEHIIKQVKLYIHTAAAGSYRDDAVWSEILNFYEIETGKPLANNSVLADNANVFVANGEIHFSGVKGKVVALYHVNGEVVFNQIVPNNSITLPVSTGVYIYRIGNTVGKLVR